MPEGTTELGIDIIKIERIAARARASFGERFPKRVLTDAEARYVRDRPQNFAGRWAAKEAVSKVLGLGVRGVGWRDIEIVRLPTGQPTVRLHGRAKRRAEQLGMGRIAVSISHEGEYAVAIAFGIRTQGGAFVFPLDIEERLDDRERQILARMERLRELEASERRGCTDARAGDPARCARPRRPTRRRRSTSGVARRGVVACSCRRDPSGPQGHLRHVLVVVRARSTTLGAALLAGAAALREPAPGWSCSLCRSLQPSWPVACRS